MIQRHVACYPGKILKMNYSIFLKLLTVPVKMKFSCNHGIGAMKVLSVVGFMEENVGSEPSLVLKRNDPGLLWLAKSVLELRIPKKA